MSKIWMGLQLLTSTLAPFRGQCITLFSISYQEEEILNALDLFPPMAKHPCEWRLLAGVDLWLCNTGALQRSTMTLQMIFLTWEVLEGSLLHTSNRTIVKPTACLCAAVVECGCANTITGTILCSYFTLTYQNSGNPCKNNMSGFPLSPAAT